MQQRCKETRGHLEKSLTCKRQRANTAMQSSDITKNSTAEKKKWCAAVAAGSPLPGGRGHNHTSGVGGNWEKGVTKRGRAGVHRALRLRRRRRGRRRERGQENATRTGAGEAEPKRRPARQKRMWQSQEKETRYWQFQSGTGFYSSTVLGNRIPSSDGSLSRRARFHVLCLNDKG